MTHKRHCLSCRQSTKSLVSWSALTLAQVWTFAWMLLVDYFCSVFSLNTNKNYFPCVFVIFRRAHGGRRSRCVGQLQCQETAPPFMVRFGLDYKLTIFFFWILISVFRVMLWFLLQHGDCQQHPIGGWDPARWNVFTERLRVKWRSCSCHHTYSLGLLFTPRIGQHAPTSQLWSTAVRLRDCCEHLATIHSIVPNHCHRLFVMVFSLNCHCLHLIGLFITFVKSTDLCHLVLFLPLKGFLASEVFHFVFFFANTAPPIKSNEFNFNSKSILYTWVFLDFVNTKIYIFFFNWF